MFFTKTRQEGQLDSLTGKSTCYRDQQPDSAPDVESMPIITVPGRKARELRVQDQPKMHEILGLMTDRHR